MVIEQQQILTTQNLAVLFDTFGLAAKLREQLAHALLIINNKNSAGGECHKKGSQSKYAATNSEERRGSPPVA